MIIAIVTPCFNPGEYLLETIASVLRQSGDFALQYHVQDGGSTDGSVEILESVVHELELNNTALQCQSLSFSYSSKRDRGMYDAINRGFRTIFGRCKPDIMLWINADDRLDFEALHNVSTFFAVNPDVSWIIGRTVHLNEAGRIIVDIPPAEYLESNLSGGRHDGEILPFVTQEASAWRAKLWEQCGELDFDLKYAGDFEYWRRAATAGFKLFSVDFSIGYHRKREGQLSAVGCYKDEVSLVMHKNMWAKRCLSWM